MFLPSLKHCAESLLEDRILTLFLHSSNKFVQAIICMTLLMAFSLKGYSECILSLHLALLKVFCSYHDDRFPGETWEEKVPEGSDNNTLFIL